MKQVLRVLAVAAGILLARPGGLATAESLKVHGIFRSNMVLQRDKPISIWGWAPQGAGVVVTFGQLSEKSTASGENGRWEVVFPAQAASAEPRTITVKTGAEVLEMDNILVGDVWVMNGQSNMAIALKAVYESDLEWESAELLSSEREGGRIVLTFDKPVEPDDKGPPEGFAIAGDDGKFYLGHASYVETPGKKNEHKSLSVRSPLVPNPVAVRYAWAQSPMGNLKVNARPWQPLPSFRTDTWDWPEGTDPAVQAVTREQSKAMSTEAGARVEFRKTEEARRALEILQWESTPAKKAAETR